MVTTESSKRPESTPSRELGRVKDVAFGRLGHGAMTVRIGIDFGAGGYQAFGNVALDEWSKVEERRVGTAGGLDLIMRLLDLFGVETLDQIKGRVVFALRDEASTLAPITGLETPDFDGGRVLRLEDWRQEWFPATNEKEG